MLNLRGRVGLQQKHAAGFERGQHLAVQGLADRGWQGTEDGNDAVPRVFAELVIGQIGMYPMRCHAPGIGQGFGLGQPHFRAVHARDTIALLRQKHRIAPLALGQTQNPALGQVRKIGS